MLLEQATGEELARPCENGTAQHQITAIDGGWCHSCENMPHMAALKQHVDSFGEPDEEEGTARDHIHYLLKQVIEKRRVWLPKVAAFFSKYTHGTSAN